MRHTDALAAVAALAAHPELHAPARAVYLALIIRSDDDGWCWPGVAKLATDTGYHPGTVRKARRALVDAELMMVDITAGGRRADSTNVYRLPVELVPTPRRGRDERFKENGKENAPRTAAPPICPGCDEPCFEDGRTVHVICDPTTPARPIGPKSR